jgi:L-arabinonolactonase
LVSKVVLHDQKTDAVSNRRAFLKVDGSRGGAADGSTVDAEGGVWNALVYDGRLVRHAPGGTIEREIAIPVKKVTSVMFGGPQLGILYVTSMAKPPVSETGTSSVSRSALDLGVAEKDLDRAQKMHGFAKAVYRSETAA